MKMLLVMAIFMLSTVQCAYCAHLKNEDTKPFSLIVTETTEKRPMIIEPNQQVDICSNGCFITLEGGDKYALLGSETIKIVNGKLTFQ